MSYKLLIVESPAKAKTINKYLGSEYKVIASYGHIRDLPKKNGSIDVNNGFEAKFQLVAKNKKHTDEIIAEAKKASEVLLASDPDREGEAIAWHISEVIKEKKIKVKMSRVTFNEITKSKIIEAISHPRELDYKLIAAQQSRLAMDYLLGFTVSPLLWRKVKTGLSAGRVQSPALRLICEREDEIRKFIPMDYFSLNALLEKNSKEFLSKLIELNGKKIATKDLTDVDLVQKTLSDLKTIKQAHVVNVVSKEKKRNPFAPFITSSLQIEGVRGLGFATDKVMKVAQGLYEGVSLNNELVGLITYMRTDSINVSNDALAEIREYIGKNFNKEYLPNKPNVYVSKVKNAQEAHEAIRPTSIYRTPESIRTYLSPDQFKLYKMIWLRTLASQLASAILDLTTADFEVGKCKFRASGMVTKFDGFTKIYQSVKDEMSTDEDEESFLPELVVGESVAIKDLFDRKHTTEPKPRYTEASLVKDLEELGIGRPSTYASIISTLKKREYVMLDKKKFVPTDVGEVVNTFLSNHLTKYVDYQFTANLEQQLDNIADGTQDKLILLNEFWHDLESVVKEKQGVSRAELTDQNLGENCPECGKPLMVKLGRYGKFVGCSGYPECKYMRKIDSESGETIEPKAKEYVEGRVCPKDGGQLVYRDGRYGRFISCDNYPKCKHIENIVTEDQKDLVTCPECHKGKITAKKGRFGLFYSCSNYPDCKTIFKHDVIERKCIECGYPVVMPRETKTKGDFYQCPKCNHQEKY